MNDDFYSRFFGENNDFENGSDSFSFSEGVVKGAKRTFSRLFLALSVYLIITFVLINAVSVFLYFVSESAYLAVFGTELGQSSLNAGVQYLIALPVFWLMVRKMETKMPSVNTSLAPREFIAFFLIAQILMTVGNYIGVIFSATVSSFLGTEAVNHTAQSIESAPMWVSFVFAVILAPIAEELLMRKLFIDRIAKYGTGFAVIVSAVTFGIFHGNFFQFFYATLSGLVLGALYVRGGLKYSVAMHMLINFWGSVMALLYNRALETAFLGDTSSIFFWLSLAMVVAYVILAIIMLFLGIRLLVRCIRALRYSFHPFDGRTVTLPGGSLHDALFGNAGVIIFLIISGISLILSFF